MQEEEVKSSRLNAQIKNEVRRESETAMSEHQVDWNVHGSLGRTGRERGAALVQHGDSPGP